MRQGRDRARFLELGLLLLQLCSLFRSDGALIEGKNRRDTGQHQRGCAESKCRPTSLTAYSFDDPRFLHPGEHRAGERVVVELEQRSLAPRVGLCAQDPRLPLGELVKRFGDCGLGLCRPDQCSLGAERPLS